MRVVWRAAVVLAVFVGVGLWTSHVVMAHELAKAGAPVAEVRLVSWMAGLFGGGLAAVLVGIAVVVRRGG
jgi:hypothetical protein